jgi:hypothetical protein
MPVQPQLGQEDFDVSLVWRSLGYQSDSLSNVIGYGSQLFESPYAASRSVYETIDT